MLILSPARRLTSPSVATREPFTLVPFLLVSFNAQFVIMQWLLDTNGSPAKGGAERVACRAISGTERKSQARAQRQRRAPRRHTSYHHIVQSLSTHPHGAPAQVHASLSPKEKHHGASLGGHPPPGHPFLVVTFRGHIFFRDSESIWHRMIIWDPGRIQESRDCRESRDSFPLPRPPTRFLDDPCWSGLICLLRARGREVVCTPWRGL